MSELPLEEGASSPARPGGMPPLPQTSPVPAEPSSQPQPARVRSVAGRRLRVGWRRAVSLLQRLDPSRAALRPATAGASVALVCVYRRAGVPHVHDLVASLPGGASVGLWSLDGFVPAALAPFTLGSGPGTRAVLLNRLIVQLGQHGRPDALLLVDDDVRFAIGGVAELVSTGLHLGLDLFQPAHLASSHANWEFVRRRALTVARQTDFVEQGPVVVLSARAQQALLPLPEDMGMSWGIEVRWWAAARRHDLRIGLVDGVAIRHLAPTATTYDRRQEERSLAAELEREGLPSIESLQVVARTWRPSWRDAAHLLLRLLRGGEVPTRAQAARP